MVLQYILNQVNQEKLLLGLRPKNLSGLKILRCYIVRALYIPEVIETEVKNNQAKKECYNSSLVIVDWLTTSDACKHKLFFRHCHRIWNNKQDSYGTWSKKTLLGALTLQLQYKLSLGSLLGFVMPGSRDLESRDLATSSYYQAKILHTSTSALLSLGSISPPLQPFFHPHINSDTTCSTNQH